MLDLQTVIEAAEAHARMGEQVTVKVEYHGVSSRLEAQALTLDAGLSSRADWTCGKPLEDSMCPQTVRWYDVEDKDKSTARVDVAVYFTEVADARA
jgi:hypothetical protein